MLLIILALIGGLIFVVWFVKINLKEISRLSNEIEILSPEVQKRAESDLFYKLCEIAKKEDVPIFIKSREEMKIERSENYAAGKLCYYKDNSGSYCLSMPKKIYLQENCIDPWVLSHELGHHFSLKKGEKSTEEEADIEAKNLVLSLLDEKEKHILRIDIRVRYEKLCA